MTWWVLVLTVIANSGVAIDTRQQFMDQPQCEDAVKLIRSSLDHVRGVCVPKKNP